MILGVALPVVGTITATVLGFIATARFGSYDAYDAVWSRRRLRYRAKVAYLREHRWRTLGLGAVMAGILVVPGLNSARSRDRRDRRDAALARRS